MSILPWAVLFLVCVNAAFAQDAAIKVGKEEAAMLASLALSNTGGSFEGELSPRSGFYIFQGVNPDSEREGSVTFGFFAVNPWTGDVWDMWDCGKRFNTPALRKAQAVIRKRFTADEAKRYQELRDRYPGCDVG
ncbi:hypothetical protein [Paramagnetospirillum magnetotacticum]|nr:hypothetical protein [Paramagnetospirillum magnetotacticum]